MKPREDLRALLGESEADRLARLIGGIRTESELRAFWTAAQGNPALSDPRVVAAKDQRKSDLMRGQAA